MFHNIGSNGFDMWIGPSKTRVPTVKTIRRVCLNHGVQVKSVIATWDGESRKLAIQFSDDHTEETLETILKELASST